MSLSAPQYAQNASGEECLQQHVRETQAEDDPVETALRSRFGRDEGTRGQLAAQGPDPGS